MASFIIHTIAAEILLKEITTKYQAILSQENINKFLLGNLIVDSINIDTTIPNNLNNQEIIDYKMYLKDRNRQEKIITHFRDPQKEYLCQKLPEPERFINKYQNIISKDISVIGYLFHLYTDRYFFSNLFPKTFKTYDKAGNETNITKDSYTIKILKNNQEVSDKIFWTGTSPLSIYNDYTKLNKLLIEYYGTSFDANNLVLFAKENFINPGIEEVDYNKIIELINKTNNYIEESYNTKDTTLNVFDEEIVKQFINDVVINFINDYGTLFKQYLTKRKKDNMILASNNKGKIKELKSILETEEIISLKEANIDIEVEENADSFYGNALKKAKEIYKLTNIPVIADDSGICINALSGWPGVLTHRFAGEEATDKERNDIIVSKVMNEHDKSAQVICNLVYYDGTNIIVGEGIINGKIVSPRGENGFGFDPIFELPNGKTLAELSNEEKNLTSARYLAALDLKEKLKSK